MKDKLGTALTAVILLVALACGLVIWTSRHLPVQPATTALARVTAIAPSEHRFHPNQEYIVVRNARATGQFEMPASQAKCDVGDEVVVEQRGTTLTRLPATCR